MRFFLSPRLFLASLLCLSIFARPLPLPAQETQNCGLPGFVFLPCDPRFPPQRSDLPGGVKQLFFQDPQTKLLFRTVSYASVAQETDPLRNLIAQVRDAFLKQYGQNPREAWEKSKNGVDFFSMDFGQGRFVVVGAVQQGYLVGAFHLPTPPSPLALYLQSYVTPPPPNPVQIALYPPKFPSSAALPTSPSEPSPDQARWRCYSRGYYEVCRQRYGSAWERNCVSRTADAVAAASSRQAAASQANSSCSTHMTRMILTANIAGIGRHSRPCQVYRCTPSR